jgi:endothelin-converting enzyme/putative endopeptidase
LVRQYDQYAPFPDLHLNGQQTLGENVADVAGLSAAYDGYHASLKGKKAPEQAGYDGDQQFFIAYGQNWATKIRDASLRRHVMTDPHSPGEYSADTVRNIDAWYNAFKVPDTAKLYLAPNQRVRIW